MDVESESSYTWIEAMFDYLGAIEMDPMSVLVKPIKVNEVLIRAEGFLS